MKHLRVAAWTLWFMLCMAGIASAEPVSMLIAGVAGVLKAGGIGAMLIKAAFGIALQVGASLLQKAMTKSRPQAQPGITGELRVGGDNSISFVVGDYATAGSLEYTGEWGSAGGTPNAYHVQVVTLSDLPQGGIGSSVWINGQKCTIDFGAVPVEQGYPVLEFRRSGKDHVWVKVLGGSQTAADPYLLGVFGSRADRPWLSDMIGRGLTVAILTALVNRELLTQLPAARFEPNALPLYDPRKDSTVGGSGTHRWGVPSTYEPTRNNAVIIYNILRGIWHEGDLLYGPAIPATRLPLANWFAAMNECDLPIDGVAQFRCGYEIKIGQHQPLDVIQELLKGCNGKIAEVGGIYKIHVGAPALPTAFIADDEFVVTDEQEFEPFPGLESTFNGAAATYPEPEAAWEMKDAPQRLFPAYEAEDDGRRLLADFQFNAVPFPLQVQRLMKSMVEDGRRFRKHRGTLAPWAFVLEPMDTISWTSAREGYSDKLFQIDSMDDQVNGNQAVAFRETDPSDFDWNASTDELPWSVGPIVPQWPSAQVMVGWQVFPATLGPPGKELPSILVSYPGDLVDVRAIRAQVRLSGETGLVFDGESPYGNPATNPNPAGVILNGAFSPATDYEARGIVVPFSGREAEWSEWLPVKTPNVWIGDIYPVDLDRLAEDVRGFQNWAGGGIREIKRRLEEFDLRIADQDLGNAYDRQQIRKQLTATYEHSKAEWTYEVNVVAAESYALARRVEELDAEVFDPETGLPAVAGAVDVLEAYAGPDGALANAVTALSASSTPGEVSEANFRMEAVAGPTGYSRIGLQTRQGGAGSWRGAAAYLDTPNNPAEKTRFAVVADQMVVMDGNGDVSAVFDGDTAYFDNARIRNLDADNINVAALTATAGFFDNVYIDSSLQLGPNVVVEGTIQAGAITNSNNNSFSGTNVGMVGTWTDTASIVIDSPSLNPILIFANYSSYGTSPANTGGAYPGLMLRIRIVMNGVPLPNMEWAASVPSYSQYVQLVDSVVVLAPVSQVTNTITIQVRAFTNAPAFDVGYLTHNVSNQIVAQCNKK